MIIFKATECSFIYLKNLSRERGVSGIKWKPGVVQDDL